MKSGSGRWRVRILWLDRLRGLHASRCWIKSSAQKSWPGVHRQANSLGVERSQTLGGDARVNKLAASLGWSSPLHLEVQRDYGLTPKAQARRWAISESEDIFGPNLASRWLRWLLSVVTATKPPETASSGTGHARPRIRAVRFSDLPGLPAEATKPNRSFFFKTEAPETRYAGGHGTDRRRKSHTSNRGVHASKSRGFLEQMFGWKFHPFARR